jgi:hypothetical protein
MLVCALAVPAAEARAADLNAIFVYQQSPVLYGDLLGGEPDAFWELFNVQFDNRAAGVFEDQYNPFNFSNWNALWTDRNFNQFYDYNTGVARHTFSDAFRSSARDAALELDLPMLEWMGERQGFLSDFLWNSLDSVEEQSVSPLNLSYQPEESSWWNEQSEGSALRYGVRPFRTDPYAYLSWRVKDGGRVWLLGDARCYYVNFGNQRFELALSAPIAHGVSIELGTSYQFGTQPAQKEMALKLLKTFKSGGIVYVALQEHQQSAQPGLIAGITVPW